ncbi:unnamed protein product [Dovyalis caffra]|uniref:Uncharacterized protein n=1 Tax=Dovyalis caffra TaxID=77055 RepID=A0AAV1S791_9ROSI|nr:unnamed protein product [Dovyalis caffra]
MGHRAPDGIIKQLHPIPLGKFNKVKGIKEPLTPRLAKKSAHVKLLECGRKITFTSTTCVELTNSRFARVDFLDRSPTKHIRASHNKTNPISTE